MTGLVLLIALSGFSQTTSEWKDSLRGKPADSVRFSLLLRLSGMYRFSKLDSAIHYGEQALAFAKKKKNVVWSTKAHYQLGTALLDADRLEDALRIAMAGRTLAEQAEDLFLMQLCNALVGSIYRTLRSPEKALPYQMEALSNAEEMGDTLGMAYAFNGISTIYSDQKDTVSARKFLREALALFPPLEAPSLYVDVLTNLSLLVPSAQEERTLLAQAEKQASEIGDTANLVYVYNFLGSHFFRQERFDSSLYAYEKADQLATSLGDRFSRLAIANNLAAIHLELGNMQRVDSLLQFVFTHPSSPDQPLERLKALETEAEWAARNGAYRRAYTASEAARVLMDSTQQEATRQLLSDASIRYETAQKENQIKEQQVQLQIEQRKRWWQLTLAGLVILLALLGIFILRQQRYLTRQELAIQQQRAGHLEELDRMKSRFFAQVSHDFRTPLTLVLGPLEKLLSDQHIQRIRPDLELIRRNAQRLLVRVNELLDISRLEAGKLEVCPRPVPLADFTRRTCGAFTSFAESKQQQLGITITTPDDLWVHMDADKVEKIINNLLHNAVKFSGLGKTISVHSGWESDRFFWVVDDSGPGIPEEYLRRIFEPFYRAAETAEQVEGSGLGLSIAYELARLLGGELQAENCDNGGVRFTLQLPAPRTEATQKAEQPEQEGEGTDTTERQNLYVPLGKDRPRLLVVEDQAELADFIGQSLDKDFQVVCVENGYAALDMLRERSFDLIVSDIMMPKMDGFGLRAALMREKRWSHLPFVFLTARSLEQDRLQALRMGVDDYLIKPFSVAELRVRLVNLLERQRVRRNAPVGNSPGTPATEQLLRQAEEIVRSNMEDPACGVAFLAQALGYSTRQLGRILKKETGLSPVAFILELRLQEAYRLLQTRQYFTVNEVRYAVGIASASYFTNKFTQRFGFNPSDLLQDG